MSELTIDNIIAQSEAAFLKIATDHKLVKWAEESQFAMQAIYKNVKLQQCVPTTIRDAIINVAAVGLTLNPAYQYAYLVPQARNIGTQQSPKWVEECHLRISYKGLIAVATSSGSAEWVNADVVHKEDDFKMNGKWALPNHEFNPFSEERGKPIGVYCVAKMPNGEYITETAPWSEVLKAKAAAKTDNVWKNWESEMARKFIVKRASKYWPRVETRLDQTVDVINQYEGSDFDRLKKIEETASYLIAHIAADDVDAVLEAYDELEDDEKQVLWTAKTKGGWLTQDEKAYIKSASFERYQRQQEEQALIEDMQ